MDLSFLASLDSLSRVHSLVPEARRRCEALQEEAEVAEHNAPALLAAATDDVDHAHRQLAELAVRASQLEADLLAQTSASSRLSAAFEGPHATLKRLRRAEIVLATLVDADELSRSVERAVAEGDRTARNSALLRLLLLRLIVFNSIVGTAGAVQSVADASSAFALFDHTSKGAAELDMEEERVTRALARIVGSRLQSVLTPLKQSMLDRVAAALKALGWPAIPQADHTSTGASHHLGGATHNEGSQVVAQSMQLQELKEAICDALLLQFCSWASCQGGCSKGEYVQAISPTEDPNDSQVRPSSLGGGDDSQTLWALDTLCEPLLKRFRYHFEGRRETNRRDKPEWVFAHCVAQMRAQAPFLSASVQPLLRTPIRTLEAVAREASTRAALHSAYMRFLSSRAGSGVEGHVAEALCHAMVAKLHREMASRLSDPPLFCHTLSEAVECERELRFSLRLSPAASVLRAFTAHAEAMELWLKTERADASARVEDLLSDHQAWEIGRDGVAVGSAVSGGSLGTSETDDAPAGSHLGTAPSRVPLPPLCARGVMKLSFRLFERIKLVAAAESSVTTRSVDIGTRTTQALNSNPAASRLLHEVLLPTLSEFSAQLRAKTAQAMIGTVNWRSVGAILSAILFSGPLLEEWQEDPLLVELAAQSGTGFAQHAPAMNSTISLRVSSAISSPFASSFAGTAKSAPLTAPIGVFVRLLESWYQLRQELEEHTHSTLTADFCEGAAKYVSGLRAFRLAAEEEDLDPELPIPCLDQAANQLGTRHGERRATEVAGAAIDIVGEVTPSLCEPLALLRSQLSELRAIFPSSSLRRVWRSLATAIDRWIYESVVRRATFSPAGARQFIRDARAILDSLVGVTAAPHAAMPRIAEVAAILRLSRTARHDILRMVNEGAGDALARRREEEGIHTMSDDEIQELLDSIVYA